MTPSACTIFHNDIRSFGKGFEAFFQRAEQLPGVRFIRSYASIEKRTRKPRMSLSNTQPDDGVKEEFDMVVLSVGLNPPAERRWRTVRHRTQRPRFLQNRTLPIPWRPPGRGFLSAAPSRGPWISPSRFLPPAGRVPMRSTPGLPAGQADPGRVYPPERDVSKRSRASVCLCVIAARISAGWWMSLPPSNMR
jgi:heterodisulfide reductase subunit A